MKWEGLTMAMNAVLKQLESRIEELVSAYGESKKREAELAAKVKKLDQQLAADAKVVSKIVEYDHEGVTLEGYLAWDDAFEGKSRIQRHRLVYAALGTLMQTDIHALKINAYSPGER